MKPQKTRNYKKTTKNKNKSQTTQIKKAKTNPDTFINYIDDQQKRKNSYCPTLISKNNTEKAANKPIIRGKVENEVGKIFCDTGAEINFIATETANKFKQLRPECIVTNEKYNIKCANGSRMTNKGVIRLKLNIANNISEQRFVIVDNLFPRIIIGLKTMKDIGLKIVPKHSGVEIGSKFIPFISKVHDIDNNMQVNSTQSDLSTGM